MCEANAARHLRILATLAVATTTLRCVTPKPCTAPKEPLATATRFSSNAASGAVIARLYMPL
eukprot:14557815-Alexandrium_andersonii.AAC.1